ncbi:MAG: DNA repair protein RadC [Paramuribaculum sp.]|nr:DNA repair protein RadC [Paramuribaculum sp.]MDE6324484.1 DNA repair protein RadC [Paramuribaculum sp.]MDE6488211.1 DNA repair protein RadC [Paramuribaculum sp.]
MKPNPTNQARRIADLNNDDKPREKALAKGIRTLSDAELLALLIGGGVPGKSAIDLAREILDACDNSLAHLSQMSIQSISRRFVGIGPAKATTIAAALEIGARSGSADKEVTVIRQSSDAYRCLLPKMRNLPHEEFWVIFLRRNNSVIICEQISSGGSAATYVEPRMIVKKALDNMASAIILGHNHPSGNLRPSIQDDTLTKRIKDAASLLDIAVHDHIIVTPEGFYSYADEGRI